MTEEKTRRNDRNMKFSDPAIAGLMQLVQLSLLTMTDITDFLRIVEFNEKEPNSLFFTDNCIASVEEYCEQLMKKAGKMAVQMSDPNLRIE